MADITVTAARVAVIDPTKAEIFPAKAEVAITAGQAVYLTASGTVDLADANAAGAQQMRGIALETVSAGQTVDVLKRGRVAGFTVSGMAYDAQAFLSNNAGALADAAGAMTVPAGRVVPMSDMNLTKVLYFEASWLTQWS